MNPPTNSYFARSPSTDSMSNTDSTETMDMNNVCWAKYLPGHALMYSEYLYLQQTP